MLAGEFGIGGLMQELEKETEVHAVLPACTLVKRRERRSPARTPKEK